MTLNQAPVRQWQRIAAHSAHHPRLLELGFMPLENVRVLQRSWFKSGALVVQVGDAVFGVPTKQGKSNCLAQTTPLMGSPPYEHRQR